MSCIIEETEGNLNVILRFRREDLLYDIENTNYIEGHILKKDNNHIRHMIHDVCQEGNVDKVTRSMDLAVAEIKKILEPYSKTEIEDFSFDNKLIETPVYGIILNLPKRFSQTTLNLLEKLIHEFIVSQTISDWFAMIYPEKAKLWDEKATGLKQKIRVSIHSGIKLRRKVSPFGL